MLDVFCSEYGWLPDYVKYELRMDEAAKLFHAILFRKGAKTYRKQIIAESGHESLADKVAAARAKIDTITELEGIVWH